MKLRVSLVLEPGDDPESAAIVLTRVAAEEGAEPEGLAVLDHDHGQADISPDSFGAWSVSLV